MSVHFSANLLTPVRTQTKQPIRKPAQASALLFSGTEGILEPKATEALLKKMTFEDFGKESAVTQLTDTAALQSGNSVANQLEKVCKAIHWVEIQYPNWERNYANVSTEVMYETAQRAAREVAKLPVAWRNTIVESVFSSPCEKPLDIHIHQIPKKQVLFGLACLLLIDHADLRDRIIAKSLDSTFYDGKFQLLGSKALYLVENQDLKAQLKTDLMAQVNKDENSKIAYRDHAFWANQEEGGFWRFVEKFTSPWNFVQPAKGY